MNARPGAGPDRRHIPMVSHSPIDAGGVTAEWVEATAATVGQPTIIFFTSALDAETHGLTGDLAVTTGARVLAVACRHETNGSLAMAGEQGAAAYAWLLNEGLDLTTTAFIIDAGTDDLTAAIMRTATARGLPLPQPRCHQAHSGSTRSTSEQPPECLPRASWISPPTNQRRVGRRGPHGTVDDGVTASQPSKRRYPGSL